MLTDESEDDKQTFVMQNVHVRNSCQFDAHRFWEACSTGHWTSDEGWIITADDKIWLIAAQNVN